MPNRESRSGPRREIAVLTNPTAGKGRGTKILAQALPRLRAAGFAVRSLQGDTVEESLELAQQCVADGVDTLAVVGGDGMVHLAIQALAHSRTRLGLIPAGTGNDVARYFDIPRKDVAAAVDILAAGKERVIDLAKVGPTYFLTVLAAGFDAIVNERANQMTWPKGQMRYNIATLAELRTFSPLPYVLVVDGVEHRFDAMLVAVGNGESFGGGLRITHGASLDDGELDVAVIGPMKKRELITTYPQLFKGTHVSNPRYVHYRGREITVAAPGITGYADGERIGALPLTVTVQPSALRVVVA